MNIIKKLIPIILLLLIIWIDLPENLKMKFNLGKTKINYTINPLSIDFNLFSFPIRKNFTTKLGLDLKMINGGLNDEMVAQILAGCKALIIPGIEDFGLTSLEAQALGKPVVAFAEGGVLETVMPSKTGILFNQQTEESLADAFKKLDSIKIKSNDCTANAAKFSKEKFISNFKQTVASMLYTN